MQESVAQQILQALIRNGRIECLDISRTGIGNDINCIKTLGELIQKNGNLRALGLQALNLSDMTAMYLIDPLVGRLNIEGVNFNHNRIGFTFV